jgi:thymidylate synthase ThyX
MSFLQESQRYCSYIKEKFGASVTFIQPDWIKDSDQKEFEEDIKTVEKLYFKWLNKGYKAEEARYFLINGTKTEIVITAFASDWRYMLDLRYFEKTGKVSPDMKSLMQKAQKVMQEAGIWGDIMKYPSKFE